MDDPDPTNNRDHYYLPDAMGGNVGLYYDTDGDESTSRVAVFNQFDAFGVPMSKTSPAVGTRACRCQEGSITDRDSGLVYMLSRHYDPSIGRFIQADSLSMGSLSTQGMNRYIYVNNDPVNATDPTGRFFFAAFPAFGFLAFVLGAVVGGLFASAIWPPSDIERLLRRELWPLVGAMGAQWTNACTMHLFMSELIFSGAVAAGGTFTFAAMVGKLFGMSLFLMGASFFAGMAVGFAVGALVHSIMASAETHYHGDSRIESENGWRLDDAAFDLAQGLHDVLALKQCPAPMR